MSDILRNNKQFNYNTNFHYTNKNLFLKYLATKQLRANKLPFYCIT